MGPLTARHALLDDEIIARSVYYVLSNWVTENRDLLDQGSTPTSTMAMPNVEVKQSAS
jgi:hypothetical protein